MSKKLFENSDSESDNEKLTEFKTNEQYAKVYNKFRQKELLKKLKDRGLNDSDTEESSESADSESEEDIYDPKFDEEFYKTLSSLKSKDPSIYDKKSKFFDNYDKNDDNDGNEKKNKKRRALTLKDYERKVILEKGGIYEDDEDENEQNKRSFSPSYNQEQEQLKKEFKQLLNDNDDEDEEFGGIFKKRNKTEEEKEKEEEDFVKWLAGKKDEIDENKKEKLNPLKQYWNNPNLSKQEQFLRDYVLNNGYIKSTGSIPTYEEIVGDVENLSEDEKELEKQADFEHKFNFRFEETDKEFIKRYPRTIENSVRKVDDKRKLKRLEVKERKKKEKEQKYQEIEMLKELKRKEIEEKIQKLKEVTGNDELPFADEDLEEDFDPEAHDKRMKEIFNDDYYQVEDDEEKPECPDIEELKIEDWDNYDPNQDEDNNIYHDVDDDNNEPHCEDDDFIMDCDYEENCKEKLQNELIENTKSKRKRKGRRNHFMEMIKKEKPVFNPEDEKTYAEYIDEYYKMDCEDIIGDQPCRFKYVETVPNDFGLTIEEILLAKNKELNQWASLKKATQIRPEHVERNEVKLYKLKAQNLNLKKKIFRSLYGSSSSDEEDDEKDETSKKTNEIIEISETNKNENSAKKNKNDSSKNKNKKHVNKFKSDDISQSNSNNKSNIEAKSNSLSNNTAIIDTNHSKPQKKKKKKNKIQSNDNSNVEQDSSKMNRKREHNSDSFKNSAPTHKKKKVNGKSNLNTTVLSEERLKAYGLNPRKFYKKQKFMSQKFKNNKKS